MEFGGGDALAEVSRDSGCAEGTETELDGLNPSGPSITEDSHATESGNSQ